MRSVIQQDFQDLEVIVCDNSDPELQEQTASVVDSFNDDRIRYIRTNGRLSMPDNWEHAVLHARGTYVGVLTDRSVFKPNALSKVNQAIDETDGRIINWFNDLYGRGPSGRDFRRRPSTLRRYHLTSAEVLDYFLHGNPKWSTKIVPKLMTSVFHRSVIDAIRQSPAQRCCLPVAPDFTSGFLALAHCDWVLTLDDALYVSVGTGNGAAFRRRGELAERFRADLGLTWHDMVDRMPTDACFAHALVLNDLMRVRDLLPDEMGSIEIDRAQYYLGCLNDYVKTYRHGVDRAEDLESLLAGLDRESPEVQQEVRSRRVYAYAVMPDLAKKAADTVVKPEKAEVTEFASVWDAIAWDVEHPRDPIRSGFLDEKPGLETVRRVSPRRLAGLARLHETRSSGRQANVRSRLRERVLGLLRS